MSNQPSFNQVSTKFGFYRRQNSLVESTLIESKTNKNPLFYAKILLLKRWLVELIYYIVSTINQVLKYNMLVIQNE